MRPSSAKAKGRRLQNVIAKKLQTLFGFEEDDCRGAIMGENGEDIKLSTSARESFPYSIEAKNVERLNLWEALKQAEENCPEGSTPLVIFKKNHSKTYGVVEVDHLFSLIRGEES